ncbi:MAG: hypothetical protein M3Z00_00060 [Actinomycetota bacterium]|nr:hypothetical protein [Actinomycetota bacterium]
MSRRTGEQTKALLIETGIGMLLERGTTAGVSHIRLQEVVRRAGLTTGAAYRLWADQDAFHHDLAVGAASWRGDEPVANTLKRIGALIEARAPLMEVIRQGSQAHVEGFHDEDTDSQGRPRSFLVALALRATSASWVDLRDASVARHADSVSDFARLYGQLMDTYGLRMRPPLTLEQFTLAMAALGEGFALQAIQGVDHPRIRRPGPAGVGDDWTLFGLAVWSLVEAFTQECE